LSAVKASNSLPGDSMAYKPSIEVLLLLETWR
jgi:hypothetical protein